MKAGVRTISIVGVDGTGKSSTIEQIKGRLGDKIVCVQYMGSKLWETKIAKKYRGHKLSHTWNNVILNNISLIFEMYYRVLKYKGKDKIIIYDRYVDELILFRESRGDGFKNRFTVLLYKFFFRWMFPKPQATFYLTCPIEESVKRKSDLSSDEEIKTLKRNKQLLDNYYYNKEGVFIIDTSSLEQHVVVDKIIEEMQLSERFLND